MDEDYWICKDCGWTNPSTTAVPTKRQKTTWGQGKWAGFEYIRIPICPLCQHELSVDKFPYPWLDSENLDVVEKPDWAILPVEKDGKFVAGSFGGV